MPPEAEISFTIDFKKGSGNPRRVFDAASELIAGFESLDDAMVASVDGSIETAMVLEDVKPGSIKVFLTNALKSLDDDALKSGDWKKAVGAALVKAKHAAIEFLDKDKATAYTQIDGLVGQLQEIAKKTDIKYLPDYPPIHEGRLLSALDKIQDAKRLLGPGDRLIIEADGKPYEVNLTQTWSPSRTITVIQDRETHSEGEIVLAIRKPDLLGEAMWQFGHGKVKISASISDEAWLQKFHNRQIALYSGDGMRCRVRFTYTYDDIGTLLDQRTEIIEVLEIIKGGGSQQGFTY